jgi:hypothetical protein
VKTRMFCARSHMHKCLKSAGIASA